MRLAPLGGHLEQVPQRRALAVVARVGFDPALRVAELGRRDGHFSPHPLLGLVVGAPHFAEHDQVRVGTRLAGRVDRDGLDLGAVG